jgi:threonine dehydratase
MADPNSLPLSRASVLSAHALITPFIHRTPVLTSTYISQLASTPRTAAELEGTPWAGQTPSNPKIRFWFKCENFQKVGAFKARGAFHALLRLVESEGWEEGGGRERGVVTHSSGEFFCARLLSVSS